MGKHQCEAAVGDAGEKRRRLVGAEVERPHRREEATQPRERRCKGNEVLVFGRPGARLEKGQLRAQEPDTFGAGLETRRHLRRGGSVAEQRHDPPVARDRGEPTRCNSLLAQQLPTLYYAFGREKPGRARVDDNGPVVSVDDHRISVSDREHVLTETDCHRHAERARHDRCMGGGSPLGQRDAENQAFFEAKFGHVRRA
jgi:hypothetical protein